MLCFKRVGVMSYYKLKGEYMYKEKLWMYKDKLWKRGHKPYVLWLYIKQGVQIWD